MRKITKRFAALVLTVTMICSMVIYTNAATPSDFLDFPNDWSTPAMTAAVNNGLLLGNEKNMIEPGSYLTRAEMATIITRAFGASQVADISGFTDLSSSDWFYDEFAKAVQMDIFSGNGDSTMTPNDCITREQAICVIARALVLLDGNASSLAKFKDASSTSSWAVGLVSAMVERGYVNGNEKSRLNPLDYITRAEFAQLLYNIFSQYITTPGTYFNVAQGNVIIRTSAVNLSNVTVNGDLIIGDGGDQGTFILTNVNIKGRLVVRGGANISLVGVTVGENVVVKNPNGVVRFNNYATDVVFNNIKLVTQAIFKSGSSIIVGGGGSSGGGSTVVTTANYTVKHFKENVDGTYSEAESIPFTGVVGDTVTAAYKTYDGFESYPSHVETVTSGSVASDGSLVLKLYYRIKRVTVTFYDIDTIVGTPKEVMINTKLDAGDIPAVPYSPINGYKKNSQISPVYADEETHQINYTWWYKDDLGEWKEFDSDVTVTKNMSVYVNLKKATLFVYLDNYSQGITVTFNYEPDTRVIDVVKDALFINKANILDSIDVSGLEDEVKQKAINAKIIDSNDNILMQAQKIKFATVVGKDKLKDEIVKQAKKQISTNPSLADIIEDYIEDSISINKPAIISMAKRSVREQFAGSNAASAKATIKSALLQLFADESGSFNDSLRDYLNMKLDANDTAIVKVLVEDTLLASNPGIDVDTVVSNMVSDESFRNSTIDDIITELETNSPVKDVVVDDLADYLVEDSNSIDFLCDIMIEGVLVNDIFKTSVVEYIVDYLHNHTGEMSDIVDMIIEDVYKSTLDTFINELKTKETFTITDHNKFIAEGLKIYIEDYTFDDVKDKIPSKIKEAINLSVFETLFNDAKAAYLADLTSAIANVTPSSNQSAGTGFEFIVNPIADIVEPLYNDMYNKIRNKLMTYYDYTQNAYMVEMLNLISPATLFEGSSALESGNLSGYKIRDIEYYYDLMVKLAVLSDDAYGWFYDNLTQQQIDNMFADFEPLVIDYTNLFMSYAREYAATGVLPSIFDNTVGKNLEDKIMNSSAGSKIDTALDKFITSKFNRDITSADYAKIKEYFELIYNSSDFTMDEVFDEILTKSQFDEIRVNNDSYIKYYQDNYASFKRAFRFTIN